MDFAPSFGDAAFRSVLGKGARKVKIKRSKLNKMRGAGRGLGCYHRAGVVGLSDKQARRVCGAAKK